MYVINNFVFGHKLSDNKELNNTLCDYGIEYHKNINGKKFEVEFPYHGGRVNGDTYSCIFGMLITADDGNNDYIKEIRNSKEEDYLTNYNSFLESFIVMLNENKGQESDYDAFVEKLIVFLKNTEPKFYSVESSS